MASLQVWNIGLVMAILANHVVALDLTFFAMQLVVVGEILFNVYLMEKGR